MGTYQEGQPVRLEADFSADGVLTDPTNVDLIIWNLSGTPTQLTTADLTKDSTGKWSFEYTPASMGPHTYQFSGTGAVVAHDRDEFEVEPLHKV